MGLQYYKHVSERAINVNGATFMWEILDVTGRTILANRADIVLYHNKREDLSSA
jgi:hypothetical protein